VHGEIALAGDVCAPEDPITVLRQSGVSRECLARIPLGRVGELRSRKGRDRVPRLRLALITGNSLILGPWAAI
jgi:hypothetical protein